MNKNRGRKKHWLHYALIVLLLLAMVASFWVFTRENNDRILVQNQIYAEYVAKQTAGRVEDRIDTYIKSMNVLAYTVSSTITEPHVSAEYLGFLQDASVFDYVEFINTDGTNLNADGLTSDASDRENYILGMRGETGYHVIFNSRITHETLVNFYAPVTLDGNIIGVLNGMMREVTLSESLAAEISGYSAKSFICLNDGTIISYSGCDEKPADNLLTGMEQDQFADEESLSGLREAFTNRTSYRYLGNGSQGRSCISVVPVADSWMLVQTFPSAVTAKMESRSNRAGLKLELRLLTLFLIYVLYLILSGMRKRKWLMSEKARLGSIVQSLTPLFSRLGLVDCGKQSYEYLQGTPPDLPASGSLDDLKKYMSSHYALDEDGISELPPIFDMDLVRDELRDGKPYMQYECRVQWEKERYEDTSILCLDSRDGVPTSFVFAVQDVTTLKEQEHAIQQTLRNAFSAAEDLSQAKSDFLARMSHDMRTPMNAVLGMTRIALTHLDDRQRVRDCLGKIDEAGRKLLSLINDTLDMSKIESGGIMLEEAAFDLTQEIDMIFQTALDASKENGQELTFTMEPFRHSRVIGDAARLRQVIWNLLDNAIKYTPSGGTIGFEARELPSRTAKSGHYEFIVEDNGDGIDPELMGKIFEPFVRAELPRCDLGTGLGLPIAKVITKLMDGDIRVDSAIGKGSKFTVHIFLKLPDDTVPEPEEQDSGDAVDVPAETENLSITRHAGAKVLLVEDNALNTEIAMELLEMAGLVVETAENGMEAVSMALKSPVNYYDVILMDLQMPVMDGYEATRTIRGSGREDLLRVPIIAVSANAFQEDVSKAEDAGMNGHVMKPIELDKILEALDKYMGKPD